MRTSHAECDCAEDCERTEFVISDISKHPINSEFECIKSKPYYYKTDYDKFFNVEPVQTSFHTLKSYDLSLLVAEKLRCSRAPVS